MGSPGGSDDKESACTAGDPGSVPGKIAWGRECLPTPVFLFGEFHGQWSLAGYSPWGYKESDMTEWLHDNNCILQQDMKNDTIIGKEEIKQLLFENITIVSLKNPRKTM